MLHHNHGGLQYIPQVTTLGLDQGYQVLAELGIELQRFATLNTTAILDTVIEVEGPAIE
jgi:hypothetical protein